MVESAEYRRELEQKRSAYALLSSLFLTLPDEELVASLQELAAAPASDDVGMHEIERYARERQGMPVEETLAELAKDRVHLMRGVNKNELRPPYESLYVSNPAQGTLGSLNRFYAESGCCMSEEVKDSPDQIGVEFSFVEHLLSEELDALDEGDADRAEEAARTRERFLSQHLGRWAYEYAKEMKAAAQTGFYRGIAVMIMEAAWARSIPTPPFPAQTPSLSAGKTLAGPACGAGCIAGSVERGPPRRRALLPSFF